MGYYTRFELDYVAEHSEPASITKFDQDVNNGKKFGDYELTLDSSDWDSMKWYDYDKDMIALSLEYPNLLLRLAGQGEDNEDMWCNYYMNGDMQSVKARITYDEPDVSKFKRIDMTAKLRKELEAQRTALRTEQAIIEDKLRKLGADLDSITIQS